jgi:hypothetical protein
MIGAHDAFLKSLSEYCQTYELFISSLVAVNLSAYQDGGQATVASRISRSATCISNLKRALNKYAQIYRSQNPPTLNPPKN